MEISRFRASPRRQTSAIPALRAVLATIVLAFLVLATGLVLCRVTHPPQNRIWDSQHRIVPWADLGPSRIVIHNVRNARYAAGRPADVRYETREYDLNRLDSASFVICPFAHGVAHTFVTFGFGNEYVAISVEAQRPAERPQYSPLRGLFPQYGLTYVISDERDAVTLRVVEWNEPVYVYPVRAGRDRIGRVFLSMLRRANHLQRKPEWYNTIGNNCTTNLVRHVNEITPGRIPWALGLILNADADRVAYQRGLIATDLPFAQARRHFRVDECARRLATAPDFSPSMRGCLEAQP